MRNFETIQIRGSSVRIYYLLIGSMMGNRYSIKFLFIEKNYIFVYLVLSCPRSYLLLLSSSSLTSTSIKLSRLMVYSIYLVTAHHTLRVIGNLAFVQF